MKINYSTHFLRRARKLSKKEQSILSEKIEIFKTEPYDPKLKTHALTGKLKGLFAFSVTYSKRAMFTYVEKDRVLFIDIGSHGEVYK